jgi:acyl carrier protein
VNSKETRAKDMSDESGADDAFIAALTAFIADDVAQEEAPIDGRTDLLLTGLVDSLGVVMIVVWIESQLDITIDPGDVVLENFQTIDQMASYLRSR